MGQGRESRSTRELFVFLSRVGGQNSKTRVNFNGFRVASRDLYGFREALFCCENCSSRFLETHSYEVQPGRRHLPGGGGRGPSMVLAVAVTLFSILRQI